MRSHTVVVIGAGQAGVQVAVSLREANYPGRVLVVGGESGSPYQRPPLSKAFLRGAVAEDALALRTAEFYRKQEIALWPDDPVVDLNTDRSEVRTKSGAVVGYDRAVLATGARARTLGLPGAEGGLASLRTVADARVLRDQLEGVQSVALIGAGVVGLELAGFLAATGRDVTVIEASERVLGRMVTDALANRLADLHRDRGVQIMCSAPVVAVEPAVHGHPARVRVAGGHVVEADLIVEAAGAVPDIGLATRAGLRTDPLGVVVDETLTTSDERVLAVGDCAAVVARDGMLTHHESVQNAVDQGSHAGRLIATGERKPYWAVPRFWSDQAGLKVHVVGEVHGETSVCELASDRRERMTLVHFRHGQMVGAETLNCLRDHVAARRWLETGPAPAESEVRGACVGELSAVQAAAVV